MELTLTASRQGKLSSFLKNELKMSTGLMNRVKWADGLRVNGLSVHTNHNGASSGRGAGVPGGRGGPESPV